MAAHKITFDRRSGSGGMAAIWHDSVSRRYFADESLTVEISAVERPAYSMYRFEGYFSATSGGVKYVDENGNFTDAARQLTTSGNVTFYAQWTRIAYKITLNRNGGSNGTTELYWSIFATGSNRVFLDSQCVEPATKIEKPLRNYYAFCGYGETSSGDTLYVDQDCAVLPALSALSLTADKTVYAVWDDTHDISVSLNGGQGVTLFYYSQRLDRFYPNMESQEIISAIEPPTRESFALLGLMATNADDGVVRVRADGTIVDGWKPTGNTTIYCRWRRVSWKVNCNGNSGTPNRTIYFQVGTNPGKFFADDLCENEISVIEPPTRRLFDFRWFSSGGGNLTPRYTTSDGTITDELRSLAIASDMTIYAVWSQTRKLTLDNREGVGGSGAIFYNENRSGFFADFGLSESTTTIAIPRRVGYKFNGYYSATSGGVKYVDEDGSLTAELYALSITGNATFYAQWTFVSYALTLDMNGGTNPRSNYTEVEYIESTSRDEYVDTLYVPTLKTRIVADFRPMPNETNEEEFFGVSSGSVPSSVILRFPATTDIEGIFCNARVDEAKIAGLENTRILAELKSGSMTLNGQTVPMTQIGEPIAIPIYIFCQNYSSRNYSAMRLYSFKIYENEDLRCDFAPAIETVTGRRGLLDRISGRFHDMNGNVNMTEIYFDGVHNQFYADYLLTVPISRVDVPAIPGYDFEGYFASKTGGSNYIDGDGNIIVATPLTASATVYARWSPKTFALSFDYNGGAGPVASKSVTFGEPIGELPTGAKYRAEFDNWMIDDNPISPSDIWKFYANKTATAGWVDIFGGIKDFFNLQSTTLIPISSNSGDNRERICVSHVGKYERDVDATSGVWRNPSVTYMVVGNMTLDVRLGKAFAGSDGMSGYMITQVAVMTGLTSLPTVTVSAVANEGADAVNTFDLSVAISSRHRPQNLLGAISGGGELHSFELVALCDPVVLAENMMPCASDVVNGKIRINAEVADYDDTGAPVANNDFVMLGEPVERNHIGYKMYNVTAERNF